MLVTNGQSTKDRILDACELVYAVEGLEGLSLREVTERAGVNLAAVNYHFRTKESVTAAMLKRHLAPIHAERMTLLSQIEAALPERTRPTHIVAALFLPTIAVLTTPNLPSHFESFALRCASDPASLVRKSMDEAFGDVSSRVDAAFVASAKHMDPAEATWRSKAFFNNFPGTVINQNTLSMMLTMLKTHQVSVFEMVLQFGSVMECMMHRLADKDELRSLTTEALDILKSTAPFQTVMERMPIFPSEADASPFAALTD